MGRFRIEFSKGPEVRFISHLELMRSFERALRRAGIPLAFSQGFNPHPKMAFASALAVGVTSEREYLDIELKEDLDAREILLSLNKSLPKGLYAKHCIPVREKEPSLMAMVALAEYQVKVKLLSSIEREKIERAIKELMEKESLVITRKGKKGLKEKEIRSGIFALNCTGIDERWVKFSLSVRAGSKGNIRPEEVLQVLKEIYHIPLAMDLIVIHRTGLFKKGQEELFGKHFSQSKE